VGGGACRLTGQILTILLPAPHEHNRQAVNHNIQKTADDQAERSREQAEDERTRLNDGQQRHG